MNSKYSLSIIVGLFCLILAGSYLRLYQLSAQSYWMDEGYTINAVLSIAEHGSTVLDSGQNYSCPTYCYPTAWLANHFGNNAFSYRLLAALAGISFILALFFITRKLFDNTGTALLASGLVSFSYWQIAWSRQARWYTLYELFLWLALFFYIQWLKAQNQKLNGGLTILFTTLAIFTHQIGFLLPILMLAWFIFTRIKNGDFSWRPIIFSLVGLSLLGIILDYLLGYNFVGHLFQSIHFSYELPYWLNFYLRTYWPFVLLSLFALLNPKTNNIRTLHFLFFVFISYLLAFSFLTNIIQYRYLFALTPVFYLGSAIFIVDILNKIKYIHAKIVLLVLLAFGFFWAGFGVLRPLPFYTLEADNFQTLGNRPFYAYTPQPDWNQAYETIKNSQQSGDIVISSQPVFNKLFLNEPGYWIRYDYLGFTDTPDTVTNNREYYVGAQVINNLNELQQLTMSQHGYIVLDSMATNGRIPQPITQYIANSETLVFHQKTNSYSEIWVYKF